MSDLSEVVQAMGQNQDPGPSFQANTCALSAWDYASYSAVPRLAASDHLETLRPHCGPKESEALWAGPAPWGRQCYASWSSTGEDL